MLHLDFGITVKPKRASQSFFGRIRSGEKNIGNTTKYTNLISLGLISKTFPSSLSLVDYLVGIAPRLSSSHAS